MILVKVAHGFCPFYVRKENNIYFIHLFITENVELRLIENCLKKYRDIVCLHAYFFANW